MEELFDVCTPEGEPTGRLAPRSEAHRLGLWHRSSHLWVVNRQKEILLQRRHPGKQTDPGRWDIAVAGHLSAGQTPQQAMIREAQEELGLHLHPADLHFLGAYRKEYAEPGLIDREWQHLFAARWDGETASLVLQPEEVVEVRWMTLEAFRKAFEGCDPAYVDRREDSADAFAWVESLEL